MASCKIFKVPAGHTGFSLQKCCTLLDFLIKSSLLWFRKLLLLQTTGILFVIHPRDTPAKMDEKREKRYSQSDMQIKHCLCSVRKTSTFLCKLSPRHIWLGFAAHPLAQHTRVWCCNYLVKSQGRSPLQILLQSFCHLSFLTSHKCCLRKAEQGMRCYLQHHPSALLHPPQHWHHHLPPTLCTTSTGEGWEEPETFSTCATTS